MPAFRTLDDANLAGKRVLCRVDLNVPVKDDVVTDATRIERVLPTLREIMDKGAALIVLAHFGRPKGKVVPEMSLKPVAAALEQHLGRPVKFVSTDWRETLLVDPENGDVYLVTKSADGVSPIFRAAAPLQAGADIRLERVAGLTFGRAPLGGNASTTGGDIAPDGSAIVVRTYSAAFLWRRAPGATIAEAFATEPCALPRPRDPQGEAIGFARDGRGLYTVSEGAGTPVYFWERR